MNHGVYLAEITASETPSIHQFFFSYFFSFLGEIEGKGVGSLKGLSREQALYETLRSPFAPPFPSELIEAEMRDRRKREEKKPLERWVSPYRKADRVAGGR